MTPELKSRGVRAWEARADQLHREANRAADFGELRMSLALRRAAFHAERVAGEWRGYDAEAAEPQLSARYFEVAGTVEPGTRTAHPRAWE